MLRRSLRAFGVIAALAFLLSPLAVLAHETVPAGPYTIEYGWVNEPPVAGQANGIVINISHGETDSAAPSGTISIVSPADMSAVQSDQVQVSVYVEGVEAAQAGGVHWHLSVDDQMIAMMPLHQTAATLSGLSNGAHTLAVSLADAHHAPLGEPAQAMVTVSGSSARSQPMVMDVEPMTGAASSVGADVDVSGLKLEVVYGGQAKTLVVQPLGEDTPGQFVALLTPTRAGEYTLKFSGTLNGEAGQADVNAEVNPEEVEATDPNVFPALAAETSSAGLGLAGWLGVGGLLTGLLGLAVSLAAFTRKK